MKRGIKSLLLLLAMCCISAVSYAQDEAQQREIIGKINKAAAEMRSMESDFIQTKHISLMNERMVSEGRMVYSQGNKLRWEYVSPYKYTFILNGSSVTLKSEKRTDVIDIESNKIFQEIARIMMNSVTGKSLSDASDFKVLISDRGSEWIADLIPQKKEMKQMFKSVVLHFDKSAGVVKTIELLEKSGDKTVIELKNIKKNVTTDEKAFVVD